MLAKIGINLISLVAQIINFGLLFFILSRFLYKPLLRLFEERAKKISQGLKAAEENLKEKAKLEAQKKLEMKKTQEAMEKLLNQAKIEAKKQSALIIENARQTAKREAAKEAEILRQKLYEEEKQLKAKMAKMVIELTKKTLKEVLGETEQKKVFAHQLKKLKSVNFN